MGHVRVSETNLGYVFGPLRAMGQFEDRFVSCNEGGRCYESQKQALKNRGLASCKTLAKSSS